MIRTVLMGVVLLAGSVTAGTAASAQEVFVSTGSHGETSFSDVAEPGAERIVVESAPPRDDALAEMQRRIEQTLTVANALEESRLARETARAEARDRAAERQAQQPPQVIYQDRYVGMPYPMRTYGNRGFRHDRDRHRDHRGKVPRGDRPEMQEGADETVRSRGFVWRND
jgi:hypothetical protein